ncbi:hypothetical protein NITHO_4590002 [Nitrolancea hollandica Lb]|uniref:Uncharacterized protein n=1 Tax=Nitrolancea hollandica Lb TaxID=1129897 RepID=I4EKF1_9BACT|nr:hypothetical protein NITHO_4590002 [Nitrolancea hollandica Lb]
MSWALPVPSPWGWSSGSAVTKRSGGSVAEASGLGFGVIVRIRRGLLGFIQMWWVPLIVALVVGTVVFSVGHALGVNPSLLGAIGAGICAGVGGFLGPLIQRWLERNKPH